MIDRHGLGAHDLERALRRGQRNWTDVAWDGYVDRPSVDALAAMRPLRGRLAPPR